MKREVYQEEKKSPVPSPSVADITKALKVLSDQQLHVYQLLYFNEPRLSSPEGLPLKVSRGTSILGPGAWLDIVNPKNQRLNFRVFPGTGDENVLHLARLSLVSSDAPMPGNVIRPCCPLATPINCVCFSSFVCPLHGETHIGTHD